MSMRRSLLIIAVAGAAIAGLFALSAPTPASTQRKPAKAPSAIHKIKHVIVIMQENRSFDHYFGTYPGADGIPAGVCVSDPKDGSCLKPFHDTRDANGGGPHGANASIEDVNGGKMDGFVGQARRGLQQC